jgi:hypothetical protein
VIAIHELPGGWSTDVGGAGLAQIKALVLEAEAMGGTADLSAMRSRTCACCAAPVAEAWYGGAIVLDDGSRVVPFWLCAVCGQRAHDSPARFRAVADAIELRLIKPLGTG